MFFLLRVAFWLTVALVLLPTGSSQQGAQAAKVGTTEAVVAATAAVSDMSSFCERQANACEVGAQAAVVIGQRAQAGAKMVYEFISERVIRGDETTTGSVLPAAASAQASQSTLNPSDLEPAWQGPPARLETVPLPRPRPRRKA